MIEQRFGLETASLKLKDLGGTYTVVPEFMSHLERMFSDSLGKHLVFIAGSQGIKRGRE